MPKAKIRTAVSRRSEITADAVPAIYESCGAVLIAGAIHIFVAFSFAFSITEVAIETRIENTRQVFRAFPYFCGARQTRIVFAMAGYAVSLGNASAISPILMAGGAGAYIDARPIAPIMIAWSASSKEDTVACTIIMVS